MSTRRVKFVLVAAIGLVGAIGVTAAMASAATTGPAMPAPKASLVQAEVDQAKAAPIASKPSEDDGRALDNSNPLPTDDPLTVGVVATHDGPFSPAEFTCTSVYTVHLGTQWLFLFAGSEKDGNDTGVPAVRVYTQPDSGAYALVDVYPAPIKAGTLQVTSANGATVNLTSDDGETAVFDLNTLQYS